MATSARTQSDTITNKQIGQINDRLATQLRSSGFSAESVQLVLAAPGGAAISDMLAAFRKHVEANSDLIVRRSKPDRTLTSDAALRATGRNLYVNDEVVAAMPRGTGEDGETVFFRLDLSDRGGYISDADLDKEYELRGLVPEEPDTLAAVNQDDPVFADDHPNATHWKDDRGRYCFAAFDRWDDDRGVSVNRSDNDWLGYWWFAGRRK
ncbi:MAG: hypothetical protein QOE22_144 [Candidatus Parcubacteria bacterium]|jgi:hypothetical protein|nr:hypothetical protein [Candidatus Parcubacteria bacterium]